MDAIDELALRLGTTLPPSYRSFLSDAAPSGGGPAAVPAWSFDTGVERPRRLRFALDAGTDAEDRRVLLDLLATDRAGEWEAWALPADGGAATWYRSFGALLAGDQADPDAPAGLPGGADELVELARDATATDAERAAALRRLARDGAADAVRDLLVRDAGDLEIPTGRRVFALRWLGGSGDADVLPLLVAGADDPRSAVRAAVLPWLACSEVPRARQAAVELLVRPEVEGAVLRAARGPAAWALADAWNLTRDPRLLVQLAACGDARAVAGLVEAVPDPRTPASVRAGLVRYAPSPGDRAVVAPLIVAAGLPGAPSTAVAAALRRLEPSIVRTGSA